MNILLVFIGTRFPGSLDLKSSGESRMFSASLFLLLLPYSREIARKVLNFYTFAHENKSEINFRETYPCFSFVLPYIIIIIIIIDTSQIVQKKKKEINKHF